jgi:hypothetical protein
MIKKIIRYWEEFPYISTSIQFLMYTINLSHGITCLVLAGLGTYLLISQRGILAGYFFGTGLILVLFGGFIGFRFFLPLVFSNLHIAFLLYSSCRNLVTAWFNSGQLLAQDRLSQSSLVGKRLDAKAFNYFLHYALVP